MKKVLFVCTGNICRSSSAEAVFRHLVAQSGRAAEFTIESAGTQAYHVGEPSDSRSIAAAQARGISMEGIMARKIISRDFDKFDLILAMDRGHYDFIANMKPLNTKAEISLFMDFSQTQKGADVPDPYYGQADGFELVLDMLTDGAQGILRHLS